MIGTVCKIRKRGLRRKCRHGYDLSQLLAKWREGEVVKLFILATLDACHK